MYILLLQQVMAVKGKSSYRSKSATPGNPLRPCECFVSSCEVRAISAPVTLPAFWCLHLHRPTGNSRSDVQRRRALYSRARCRCQCLALLTGILPASGGACQELHSPWCTKLSRYLSIWMYCCGQLTVRSSFVKFDCDRQRYSTVHRLPTRVP